MRKKVAGCAAAAIIIAAWLIGHGIDFIYKVFIEPID